MRDVRLSATVAAGAQQLSTAPDRRKLRTSAFDCHLEQVWRHATVECRLAERFP
jgi:hypothetical protein